jgi:hypothetical protein
MKKVNLFIIFLSAGLLVLNTCFADETKTKPLKGIEFLTGFGWGELRRKNDYNLTPLIVDFDFNLKALLAKKINFNPSQLIQFQIEPFISVVSSPNRNVETGTSFFLKIGLLPETSRFKPYAKCGIGMAYMTQHTMEQPTQFNFTEQVCFGMHYFFRNDLGLTLEGRLRHVSNAGIREPNYGLNTYFVLAGITYLL